MLINNNKNNDNQLILTTHSPYLINCVTVAVKASAIRETISESNVDLLNKLYEIVPEGATVNSNELNIYEMNEKSGTVVKLRNEHGLPSDANYFHNPTG